MKHVKLIYRQLTSFLNLSVQEKQSVVEWYDNLSEAPSEDALPFEDMQNAVKDRLMLNLRRDRVRRLRLRVGRWSVAAVATVTLGYFGLYYINKERPLTLNELAQVKPAQGKAAIILADGQHIDLDKLAVDQSIQVGTSLIVKDAQGQIRYQDMQTGEGQVPYNSLYVPKGGMYQLTLHDGTRVRMNSDSKLRYPTFFGDGDRVVQLEGEAYFEVRRTRDKRPFIVESKRQRVQVLGTSFNVKSYAEEHQEETTLVEGAVVVHDAQDATKSVHLKPSEQAVLRDGLLTRRIVHVDDVLSWTHGQFYFDGSNTVAVLAEVARWYDISIQYEPHGAVAQYRGKIPRDLSLDRLVELLNYAGLKSKALMGGDKRVSLIIN